MHVKSSQYGKQWHFRDLRQQEGPLCWPWKQWGRNESEALFDSFSTAPPPLKDAIGSFARYVKWQSYPSLTKSKLTLTQKNKMELIHHPRPTTSDQNCIWLLYIYLEFEFLFFYFYS